MTPIDALDAGAPRCRERRASDAASSGVAAAAAHVAARRGELDVAHGAILYLEDITVSFDGFKALNTLSLVDRAGELRCIIGPNGAGKTTMMDVITGKTRPDAGKVVLRPDDRPAAHARARDRAAGIGRKFQKPTVFEHHPVFENLELALKTDKRRGVPRCSRGSTARAARPHRRDARADPPEHEAHARRPACSRTARSSGSRSACC